ncbi:uncharacterized protein LOC120080983 [Benincasa hispida]|uniref:uncharacterized protein LOC120080983 n=1 Tax=Benincasa hispida TaxID=102211 RepID=UPI00190264B1|nr:uncharacterized protein LOC120080983 [Benincasa hispida]
MEMEEQYEALTLYSGKTTSNAKVEPKKDRPVKSHTPTTKEIESPSASDRTDNHDSNISTSTRNLPVTSSKSLDQTPDNVNSQNRNSSQPTSPEHMPQALDATKERKQVSEVLQVSPLYPSRLKKKDESCWFKKFLDVLKQLYINIPLIKALEQMSSYVKFLKDVLLNKRRLGEFKTVALMHECSVLFKNNIPAKPRDLGSFTLSCSIGGKEVGHALCDLGTSINLMLLSIFKKLGIGEPRPTTITL